MAVVVKRKGHTEKFDERKVYGSVYAACSSAHYGENLCEKNAEEITSKIRKFVRNKKRIESTQIRNKIAELLKRKNEELAFFYEQHLPDLKRL